MSSKNIGKSENQKKEQEQDSGVGFLLNNVNLENNNNNHNSGSFKRVQSPSTSFNNKRYDFQQQNEDENQQQKPRASISSFDETEQLTLEDSDDENDGNYSNIDRKSQPVGKTSSFFRNKTLLFIVAIGFIVQLILLFFINFIGKELTVVWNGVILALCVLLTLGGGAYCIVKKQRALHICSGICLGLIFGGSSLAAFSVVYDISNRPLFGSFAVERPPSGLSNATEGSIVYFNDGGVVLDYLGFYSVDAGDFYCVAPILISSQVTNKSAPYAVWAACEVGKSDQSCESTYFSSTGCYSNWHSSFRSGFVVSNEKREFYSKAMVQAANDFGLNLPTDTMIVEWVKDPISQTIIYRGLAWTLIMLAPVLYCFVSIGCECVRIHRKEQRRLQLVESEKKRQQIQ